MGDNNNTTSFSLPPGTRFYPSDQLLISYYLSSKNRSDHRNDFGINLIQEIDFYNYDPFNLPDSACFRYGRGGQKRHWFCFVAARVLKRRAGTGSGGGYWKKKRGRVKDVVGEGAGKVVVGTRKTFGFYLGDCGSKSGVKTDWLMYEYALAGHPMASFVLCRVFIKSRHENNLSKHVFSSYGEQQIVATVRHVGIQYDGTAASATESKMHDEHTIDQENDVSELPSTDLNGQALTEHGAEQIGLESDGPPVLNGFSAQELMAISEGDFIELDDILCPLSGIS
ncbi:NAC domain-containing protein 68-like [Lycium ferocissimum]|uniref:NAC domain-containing protein 68-like n=1 Tax=Lycium ferocissimum TaxID=112874 RepID=UPI0028160D1B|nr:NAC domain-containing protein 68-like [Lycium ferocissimum]